MSLFSFIFFPRKLDEKRLYEIISDKLYNYSALSNFPFFHEEHLDSFSDIIGEREFRGLYISKEPNLSFKGNFYNKFYLLAILKFQICGSPCKPCSKAAYNKLCSFF